METRSWGLVDILSLVSMVFAVLQFYDSQHDVNEKNAKTILVKRVQYFLIGC